MTLANMTGRSMREVFGETLVEIGKNNKRLVVLDADVSSSTRTAQFGKVYPERFFNVGVAEANLADVAAGMATAGFRPVISTFALFLALKATDQIRNVICYNNLPVVIVGGYAGLSDSFDGASHHSISDLAVLRAFPNLRIIVPADGEGLRDALLEALEYPGPTYIRACRNPTPIINTSCPFSTGRGRVLRDGNDCTVIAAGVTVKMALEAAAFLSEEGISIRIVEMHTIKPIDHQLLEECARKTGAIVVAEEHNILGGLGSAVAEAVSLSLPVPMEYVGVEDTFTESGPYDQLLSKYGISSKVIAEKVRHVIGRKKRGGE